MTEENIQCTGRISRVDVKYMFIGCNYGSVFCPLSAAVKKDEIVPDLRKIYTVGDIVHLKACQQSGKNDCNYLATNVNLSTKSNEYQGFFEDMEDITDQLVTITNVQETLAYANNDKLGAVFVPGAAFPSDEVSRLSAYLSIGDILMVSVRSQSERSGCKWLATAATKYVLKNNKISGVGKIINLDLTNATLFNQDHGQIYCTLMAWVGGSRGTDAQWLTEILALGETVRFEAQSLDGVIRATRWTFASQQLDPREIVPTSNSTAQTTPTIESIFISSIEADVLKKLFSERPMMKMIYDQVTGLIDDF